ncbi:MAG: DUF349 domain-containing protein [Flavobacteriia bacterium]|nr:DUF349 domain-containing protein [Flavobacteriia bacterium]OIP48363.1 MAG: chromosome segregation protein [Flavobacteriaceae bacterium CG2_30_31_66]PIV96308.1 MAG: DUF349 domain-containing protein [Flavobacteriaceae bacterium CG17_big_fil_post_rev_8_21_14_2_50_31_13]PIX13187.1 MAG: DUF349 domain-containing protein [Flavobacteriaceae bacterium CG_4_8_14_3_um_filter_31_8]PIY13570.1 MAG: DUF349 domain-containing protein [Flavobacteriaceae bacterium CG_4_10_14_3_um_filter_31_253]PIZ09447.1 MAG:
MLDKNMDNTRENESELTEITPISNESTSEIVEGNTIAETTIKADQYKEAEENEEENDNNDATFEDFSALSIEELLISLKNLIENSPVQKIKTPIDQIKDAFNQKFGALLAEKRQAFLDDGGEILDFQFSSPIKTDYNKLLSDYKVKRDAYYNQLEMQLNENLEKRIQVIEDLKSLIDEAEVSTMYKNFKEIQSKWNAIGAVPKTKYNDTWKIYQHHVERFYDLLSFSNDFRDADLKNNLEAKLKIIEKAEALADEKDINFAAKQLQDLHKVWKEDIGPVSKEFREDIWEKFSEATKKIHDKRHDYFKEIHSKYDDIIEKKLLIIDEINAFDTSKNRTHNDWQRSIEELEVLRKKYFDIGKLPYAKSEEIWQKFKNATKKFNVAKNRFYKEEKSEQQENLEKKMALIEFAESIKDSDDWEMATNAFKKIQSDWKKIGHVPRKFSDDIWKRFKAACNHYFNRFHQQKNAISKEQQSVIDKKIDYLETLKAKKKLTKDEVLEAMNSWQNLGKLPRNSSHLNGKFNKFIDAALDNLSLDKSVINLLKFTNLIDSYLANNDLKKLDYEQMYVRKRIDEIVREIQQLENNLSFFSISNKNNPLVLNVKNQVAEFKEELAIWKEKLNYIRNLDY